MAVGARDFIDQLLVKKYQDQKVDNHELVKSAVSPEKMLEVMNDYAEVTRGMLMLKQQMAAKCNGLTAKLKYCQITAG